MAFDEPTTGHGVVVAFGTNTTYGSNNTNKVTNVNFDGVTTADVPVGHLGLTVGDNIPYIPGDLKEGGTVTVDVLKDLDVAIVPTHTKETITITEPITDGTNTTPGTVVFTGYVNSSSWGYPQDGVVAGQYVLKVASNFTFTPSAA